MRQPPKTIEFFYDIGSPYSYLCATRIEAVAATHDAVVRFRPFLLGAVFKAQGSTSPAQVPAKAKWMLDDLARWAKHYGVPFRFPETFPPNGVRAMRACVAAGERGKVREVTMGLFEGYFVRGIDPSSERGITEACTGAQLEAKEVLAAIETQPIKDALRASTDEAIARGAFGAPSIFVGSAMLWGNDRLVLLDDLLRDE